MVIYRTPGDGWRAVYRCGTYLDGAKAVLAKRGKDDALIELLAAQVVVVPGGNPTAHETGRPYAYVRGHLAEVCTVTADERGLLLDLSRRFNTCDEPKRGRKSHPDLDTEDVPGVKSDWFASDDFNLRAEWPGILEPHGWSHAGSRGEVEFWTRPGKYRGVSATTNHLGLGLLHVFTSSTGFQPDRSYSKYAAHAILNHGGDFSRASKELARRGYGRANDDTSVLYEKVERLFLK
jgi:putative DNA primase/helicase